MFTSDPKLKQWLVDVRRDLHMHPEISFQEERTTRKISEILEGFGIEVQAFPDITGLVGLIRGPGTGPTIALRADIDALPVQELNDVEYRSKTDGVMHACGHDANTTIMLGVAKTLTESGIASKLNGCVKFFFQPAEERVAGAKEMIARGVLDNPNVDRVIAGHMSPDLPVGSVGVFRDIGYASSDRFELAIKGKGSHGARPEEGIDPIVAGSYFVTQLQSILSRSIKPTEAGVITVGKFISGDAPNVIPEFAHLEGSIRALTGDIRAYLIQRMESIVLGLEKSFNVACDFQVREGVPVLVNDRDVAEFLFETSADVLGPNTVQYLPPIMGSEDFSYFTLERPGAIMRLGCSNPDKGFTGRLHSPYFDIDEAVLEIGVAIFSEAVKMFLKVGPQS